MLGSWFLGATVAAVDDALAGIDGAIAVLGPARLARALAERGRDVIALGSAVRSLRRARTTGVCAAAAALPVRDGALAAVVVADPGARPEWAGLLREWSRAVVDGGAVVLVDRVSRPELSRRALCGGLMEIEQRGAGRTVVTSGRVAKIPG